MSSRILGRRHRTATASLRGGAARRATPGRPPRAASRRSRLVVLALARGVELRAYVLGRSRGARVRQRRLVVDGLVPIPMLHAHTGTVALASAADIVWQIVPSSSSGVFGPLTIRPQARDRDAPLRKHPSARTTQVRTVPRSMCSRLGTRACAAYRGSNDTCPKRSCPLERECVSLFANARLMSRGSAAIRSHCGSICGSVSPSRCFANSEAAAAADSANLDGLLLERGATSITA